MAENESDSQGPPEEKASEPGSTYRIITRYWPRIAAALVALAAALEWVVGGLTSDAKLEFYVFAWASVTAGSWFLFDKAETAAAPPAKTKAANWLIGRRLGAESGTLPGQFISMFDRLFGAKHLSGKCFQRSALASVVTVVVATAIRASWKDELSTELSENLLLSSVLLGLFAFVTNVIPNYLSLLQTRWTLAWAATRGVLIPVFADLILTSLVSLAWIFGLGFLVDGTPPAEQFTDIVKGGLSSIWFFSGFFTSVWLWLYAASVLVSGVLVRMGGGVGFLLKVTDVEKQPFRSMGFTSVVIVSLLFLVGLPFVLLS
jgi:hypothetical protein